MNNIRGDPMETTRRDAIGLMGAAAAAAMLVKPASAAPSRNLGSSSKTLFWIATVTPCDKNLKFDPGAFKDILAWYKQNGADGIVVLGTTGEFASFSVAERKQIAEDLIEDLDRAALVARYLPDFPVPPRPGPGGHVVRMATRKGELLWIEPAETERSGDDFLQEIRN